MDVQRTRCFNDKTPHADGDFTPADNINHARHPLKECQTCKRSFCQKCWPDHQLDEQVLTIIQRYMDRREAVTNEGIEMQLPSVGKEEIKASLQRLQDDGIVVGWPLNAHIPYGED